MIGTWSYIFFRWSPRSNVGCCGLLSDGAWFLSYPEILPRRSSPSVNREVTWYQTPNCNCSRIIPWETIDFWVPIIGIPFIYSDWSWFCCGWNTTANTSARSNASLNLPRSSSDFTLYRLGSYNDDKNRSLNSEWQLFSVQLTEFYSRRKAQGNGNSAHKHAANHSQLSAPLSGDFQDSYFLNPTAWWSCYNNSCHTLHPA